MSLLVGNFSKKSALIRKLSSSLGPAALMNWEGEIRLVVTAVRGNVNQHRSLCKIHFEDDLRAKDEVWVSEVHAKYNNEAPASI